MNTIVDAYCYPTPIYFIKDTAKNSSYVYVDEIRNDFTADYNSDFLIDNVKSVFVCSERTVAVEKNDGTVFEVKGLYDITERDGGIKQPQ